MEQTQDLKELQKQLEGKSKAEQAEILKRHASSLEGVNKVDSEEKAAAFFTNDQLEKVMSRLVDASTSEAKKAISEISEKTTRKYEMSPSNATGMAEQAFSSKMQRVKNSAEDYKMAAKVFRAIMKSASGRAHAGELASAYDEEAEYMKKKYGRESRAMSLGTDTTGGYLAPEIWSDMLYDNIARASLARKYGTVVEMESEVLRLPRLTSTVSAYTTAEAAATTTSQPVYDQFTLSLKKLSVLTKPFSIELLELARPELVQHLTQFCTIQLAKKEDEAVFVGSDAAFTGLLESATNVVDISGPAITDLTFDDMHSLINELDEQYTPDEDITGSGIISGEARFWFNKKVIDVLAKSKGNDNYHWANVQEVKSDKKVHGYDLKRVIGMPSAPSTSTKFGAFGNLSYVWCGVRPGFRIDLLKEGSVDSVNLAETSNYALRVIEFFDQALIDSEAFSIARTAAS